LATGGRGASNHADSFTVVFPSVLLIFSYRLCTRCRILRKRLRRAGVPRNGRRSQQLQVISADDRCRCSVESLGHGEILCGDAVSVCDGQTPPNRRRKRDEWGTPGLLDILSRSSLGHPPVSVRAGQTRPTRRKVRDDVGHPRFIRYTQPFMAGPPANSPVPRICTESGNRAFGSQHRRVVQVNERKKPGRGRETFPRLFFRRISNIKARHMARLRPPCLHPSSADNASRTIGVKSIPSFTPGVHKS